MAIIAIFMSVNLISCSSDDEEVILDPSSDYGKITKNSFVATGGYRDVKPLKATILASINTTYQGAYFSMGIEFTPHQPNFNSSETQSISSNSGVTNGHFETELSWGDEGALEPGTTYYYRAYAMVGGTRYNGETRSFDTPHLEVSKDRFVDLGLSVKWASYNMGANSPEAIGTCLQQRYAFKAFNYNVTDKLYVWYSSSDKNPDKPRFFFPEGVDDDNWFGDPDYDVATRTMGGEYRIPTEDEWQELENNCNWTSGVCNGVKGFYVSDKRDGTAVIFLPYVKKSNEHDITVYLSAPDDIIRNFINALNRSGQHLLDINQGNLTYEVREYLEEQFYYDMLSIDKKLGVGEVLTEKYHHYCDHDLILGPWSGFGLSHSDFSWTHPITGKDYNFSDTDVLGGGVLYVRAVSNR